MIVYFVRHGETAYNKAGRIMGGKIDAPLDEDGIAQSKHLAEMLAADDHFDKMYVSPMRRARMTAEIINEKMHLAVEVREELRERNFGSLGGKTWNEIKKQTGQDLHTKDDNLEYDYRPYGGEAVEQVQGRLLSFINFLKLHKPGNKILVVTHFGMIELMHQLIDHVKDIDIKNDSVHKFEI